MRIVHHRLDQDAVLDRLDLDPAAVEVDLRAVALLADRARRLEAALVPRHAGGHGEAEERLQPGRVHPVPVVVEPQHQLGPAGRFVDVGRDPDVSRPGVEPVADRLADDLPRLGEVVADFEELRVRNYLGRVGLLRKDARRIRLRARETPTFAGCDSVDRAAFRGNGLESPRRSSAIISSQSAIPGDPPGTAAKGAICPVRPAVREPPPSCALRPSRVAASNDRSPPFAMLCRRQDRCPLRAVEPILGLAVERRLSSRLRSFPRRPL